MSGDAVQVDMTGWRFQTRKAWTTDAPKGVGWYWRYIGEGIVSMAQITADADGFLYVVVDCIEYDIEHFTYSHWLGPLPVPEPPEGA